MPQLPADVRLVATPHDLREAAKLLTPEVTWRLALEVVGAHVRADRVRQCGRTRQCPPSSARPA